MGSDVLPDQLPFLLIGNIPFGLLLQTSRNVCWTHHNDHMFWRVLHWVWKTTAIRSFKKDHPLVVTLLCFSLGYYLVSKITSIYVFVLGILLPILFTIVHASLRQRNITNKLTNASNVLGLSKKTPMGFILECIGLEPNFKYQ